MRHSSRSVILLCVCNACFILFLTIYLQKQAKKTVIRKEPGRKEFLVPLRLFRDILNDSKICVIEPRILWKLLTDDERLLLKERRYKADLNVSWKNTLSVAIFQDDVARIREALSKRFLLYEVRSIAEAWMEANYTTNGSFTSHLFLVRQDILFHVVILYARGHYLWSAKIGNDSANLPRDLLPLLFFGRSDSAFDRFEVRPYRIDEEMPTFYAPRGAAKFLHQIKTSSFIPCLGVNHSSTTESENGNETDTVPKWFFAQTALSVIREMEMMTESSLTQFWLASGTLLGWYRECDIIPYTHDVDFSAWAEDITVDLIEKFKAGKTLRMLNILGTEKEDLEFWLLYKWLRVDLFFTYDDQNSEGFHVGGHRPEESYSFRYKFPRFSLCSGDFLGHRVLVPCDPEGVLQAEYGNDWRIPVQSWNYEISARNVVGRRYWSNEEMRRFLNFGNRT